MPRRDIEFAYHPVADGRDCWACRACERIFYDDTLLNEDMLCAECSEEILLAGDDD